MNKACTYGIRISAALLVLAACPGLASAQQAPGTNVATPLPTQTPPALTPTSMLTMDDGSFSTAPTPLTNIGEEPVIDAETTRKLLPNRPLLITGALVLGLSYGGAAIVAATSDRDADDKLYYPVVGPWLDLNHRGCDVNACEHNTRDRALLVADGIVQGAGALGLLLSMVVPEKTTRHWYLIGNNDFVVAPQLGHSLLGVGAVGRF